MNSNRRHAVTLVLVMGIVALLAQFAGVGAPRQHSSATKTRTLAVVPGGSVPDIASTKLASTNVRAEIDETVRMQATARVRAAGQARSGATQVVCGIRYARDGDRGWSLGTPYETVVLKRHGASKRVKIDRSFIAPARDTYRMSMNCHVSAPERGARVTASGSMRTALGLPRGAATPVE